MSAQVISLSVRPVQASHLCFNVDGVLGDPILLSSKAPLLSLGLSVAPVPSNESAVPADTVAAFGFDAFYEVLTSAPTVTDDPSRLLYSATHLESYTKPHALATLRAEGRKVALHKAINARQNAFYAKYGKKQQTDIINTMNEYYSAQKSASGKPTYPNSKPNRLKTLSQMADQQWTLLSKKYEDDNRTGAFKTGVSEIGSTGMMNDLEWQNPPFDLGGNGFPATPPTDGGSWKHAIAGGVGGTAIQQEGTSSGTATTTNDDYGYRVPYIENRAQNERAQISLIDQQFAQYMAGQTLPNLLQVFANELDSIDMDVCRLQIAVLDTILMSPISGVVTGIYKNPGDFVRAGEPVVRVEDNSTLLIVGKLIYPGLISLGDVATIQTTLFDASSTTLVGVVVAARGQGQEDQWEVIINYSNTAASAAAQPILPIGYHFDYDDTNVSFSKPIDLGDPQSPLHFPL
jgi:hypothetical protein